MEEAGKPQDGFLRLSANLVVLSACQTALGKQVKGEGLIGLTRGFMHTGTPRVVASLWQVSNLATVELMEWTSNVQAKPDQGKCKKQLGI